jgi:hypothetical protein
VTDSLKARVYFGVIVVLLLVIASMAYKFIIAGSTERAEDGRLAIVLEPGERALMLKEMRDFLAGLQLISEALSRDDMAAVARAARTMGAAKMPGVPITMMGKLPIEFKTLALTVHAEFDTIAMDAAAFGVPKRTLGQVSAVLEKCVACHAAYRVKVAPD